MMAIELHAGRCTALLEQRAPYAWATDGQAVAVKGYAWHEGQCLDAEGLLPLFSAARTRAALVSLASSLNGTFSVVAALVEGLCGCCDRMRSFPLFYSTDGRYLTDTVSLVLEKEPAWREDIDTLGVAELLGDGMYTINERTLLSPIRLVEAGMSVCIDAQGAIDTAFYYTHMRHAEKDDTRDKARYYEELEGVSRRVFTRLIDSLDGKTAIIPLSGGYDSRYVICMLKKLGYPRIVCYTYGLNEGCYDTRNARLVAKALDIPCYFVETTDAYWDEFTCREAMEFTAMAHNYATLPHMQEVLALRQLRQQPDFPKDGVIITGFCGDMLGGSHTLLPDRVGADMLTGGGLISYIFDTYFPHRDIRRFRADIERDIAALFSFTVDKAVDYDTFNDCNERWFTVNKIGKFLINSFRVYEYYGYQWRIPLWDTELTDYWYAVPNQERWHKRLYNDFLFKHLFTPMGVAFPKDLDVYIKKKESTFVSAMKRQVWSAIAQLYFRLGVESRYTFNPINMNYLARNYYKAVKNRRMVDITRFSLNEVIGVWMLETYLPSALAAIKEGDAR